VAQQRHGVVFSALTAWTRRAALFALLIAGPALAGQVTLTWDPVASPLLSGYRVHYGLAAGNYAWSVDAGNTTVFEVGNLTDGATYHFAVTAYDATGNESAYSNDVGTLISVAPYAAAGTWTKLGNEHETVTVPPNTTVRYGADGVYVIRVMSGTFVADNTTFGDPIFGVFKEIDEFIDSTTEAWTKLGNEHDTVTVPPNTTIRYGANGLYVIRVMSGTFVADNTTFGDPIPGVPKEIDQFLGSAS